MKKLKVIVVMGLALVFFAGCKKETQKEFSAELAKQSEMDAGNFSILVDKMSIESEDADTDASTRASMDMAAKMISGTKISGDYLKDKEGKRMEMNMNFDLLGQKIPLNFFMDQKKKSVYMSTEFLTEINEIAKAFSTEVPIEAKDVEQLKGKYIHITEEDMKKQAGNKTDVDSFSGDMNSKLFREYLDTLESDSFEKKEDTIKRTFTKKNIQGFIKYAEENGNKDEKKAAEDLEKNIDQLTDYEQTTTLNTKKNTQKTKMKLAAKNNGTKVSVELSLDSEAKNSDKKVQLPKEADTVSLEKLEEILAPAQGQNAQVSDEDFNDLLEAIRSGQAQLTPAQIEQFKNTYKPYLTDEQYKQLEEALNQSSQMSA